MPYDMKKKSTAKKAFKPCAGCPSSSKCKSAGKCMKKSKAK